MEGKKRHVTSISVPSDILVLFEFFHDFLVTITDEIDNYSTSAQNIKIFIHIFQNWKVNHLRCGVN